MAGYETCYLTQYLQYLSPISVAIKLNTKRFKILNMGAKNHFFFEPWGKRFSGSKTYRSHIYSLYFNRIHLVWVFLAEIKITLAQAKYLLLDPFNKF